jgi:hypothetical protein
MLSAEAQVLLLSAGGARNDAALRRRLAAPLDWEKLGWLAERERAAPVLRDRLQAVGGARLPPEAAHLERLAMVAEFRMQYLEQRMLESLDALAHAPGGGIEMMLLKGAALAVTRYGSFARRPMSDLDLMVRSGAAQDARDALLRAGWAMSGLEQLEGFFADHHHLPALVDAQGTNVKLEIHTSLFFRGHPFRLEPRDIWERAQRVDVQGRQAWVPGELDQLLHLCLHFAWSHMMGSGAWRTFRDLDVLLGSSAVEWQRFIPLAVRTRGASCCYWTFRLAGVVSGVQVPASVLGALRPQLPDAVLDRVERHFVQNLLPTEAMCPSIRVGYAMWGVGIRPRWSGHGAVRPWERSDAFVGQGETGPALGRMRDHLGRLREWRDYARLVMGSKGVRVD